MIDIAAAIAFGLLAVSAVLFLIHILQNRSLADRMVALDALLLAIVSGIAIQAARTGRDTYLNVMVVTALLTLVGTALVARFIGKRGN